MFSKWSAPAEQRYGTTSPGPFRFDASTSGYSTQQTMDESNEYFNTSTRRFAGSPFPAISDQIWENKTSTSSKPTPSPFDELGAYIKSQPSQFNVASPQDAFTSVDKAVKYFSRQCIKVEGKLNHAPFVKKVCQTLVNNNWTFRAFIDERGGLENFLAATQGGYAHEISEPRWIKVSRVEEGTMWFHRYTSLTKYLTEKCKMAQKCQFRSKCECIFWHDRKRIRTIFCNELLFLSGIDTGDGGKAPVPPNFQNQENPRNRGLFPVHRGSITETYLREIVRVNPMSLKSQDIMYDEISRRVNNDDEMSKIVITVYQNYDERRRIAISQWKKLRKTFIDDFQTVMVRDLHYAVRESRGMHEASALASYDTPIYLGKRKHKMITSPSMDLNFQLKVWEPRQQTSQPTYNQSTLHHHYDQYRQYHQGVEKHNELQYSFRHIQHDQHQAQPQAHQQPQSHLPGEEQLHPLMQPIHLASPPIQKAAGDFNTNSEPKTYDANLFACHSPHHDYLQAKYESPKSLGHVGLSFSPSTQVEAYSPSVNMFERAATVRQTLEDLSRSLFQEKPSLTPDADMTSTHDHFHPKRRSIQQTGLGGDSKMINKSSANINSAPSNVTKHASDDEQEHQSFMKVAADPGKVSPEPISMRQPTSVNTPLEALWEKGGTGKFLGFNSPQKLRKETDTHAFEQVVSFLCDSSDDEERDEDTATPVSFPKAPSARSGTFGQLKISSPC